MKVLKGNKKKKRGDGGEDEGQDREGPNTSKGDGWEREGEREKGRKKNSE